MFSSVFIVLLSLYGLFWLYSSLMNISFIMDEMAVKRMVGKTKGCGPPPFCAGDVLIRIDPEVKTGEFTFGKECVAHKVFYANQEFQFRWYVTSLDSNGCIIQNQSRPASEFIKKDVLDLLKKKQNPQKHL